MTRLRILIRMESADAFELKAQALNKDSRLLSAGISALRFTGDVNYIADGEFSPELPHPTAPAPDSVKSKSLSALGSGLRVVLRMASQDAFEMKAQALNNDARLKEAGIAALKFAGDRLYISAGEFLSDLPSQTPPTEQVTKPKPDSSVGERLRVVLRMSSRDAYEMKAQALNNDPRLKDAGIAGLKFAGDQKYISHGEFSPDTTAPRPKPDLESEKIRVVLRGTRQDVYKLVAMHLNNDPALLNAGISSVGLAKGAGMVPVVKDTPASPHKRSRSFVKYAIAAIIVGLIGVTGAGALFFSRPPTPTPQPTTTEAAVIPVSGISTATDTPAPATETSVPPTATATRTKAPTSTTTSSPSPTSTVLACQPPSEAVVSAENLSCRYGPGAVYLYRAGLRQGEVVDVLGRADTAYGTWIRVRTRWEEPVTCWVNSSSKFVEIPQENVACLDPLYPEKAPLILFNTDLFPKPSNVEASRSGDLVYIQWEGYDLLPGDKPDQSPRYLVETWTCQGGKIVFTPYGTDDTVAQVRDEAGCAEPSHGQVYMAHVDGYIGPSLIPWPK